MIDELLLRLQRRIFVSGFPEDPRPYSFMSTLDNLPVYAIYDGTLRSWLNIQRAAYSSPKSPDGSHLDLVLHLACAAPAMIHEIRLLRSDNLLLREALHANGIGQPDPREDTQ